MMDWVAHPLLQALGLGVLHFLWQGMVLALLLKGLFSLFRFSSSARYVLAMSTLVLMLAAFVGTSALSYQPPVTPIQIEIPMTENEVPATSSSRTNQVTLPFMDDAKVASEPAEPWTLMADGFLSAVGWIAFAWVVGFGFFLLKLAGGWVHLRSVIHRSVPASEHWQVYVEDLSARVQNFKQVILRESDDVSGVFTAGVWRPVILVPMGFLSGMNADYVEAILLHELAHIRRYDYFFNVVQSVIEAVLYFHPAVWWVSHQARLAREHRCDDVAVAAIGDSVVYAKALADSQSYNALPLAASWKGGSLLDRVRRLLGVNKRPTSRIGIAVAFASLMVLIAVVLQIPQWHPGLAEDANLDSVLASPLDDLDKMNRPLTVHNLITLNPPPEMLALEEADELFNQNIEPPVFANTPEVEASAPELICWNDGAYNMPATSTAKMAALNNPNNSDSCFHLDFTVTGLSTRFVGSSVRVELDLPQLEAEPVMLIWDNLVWRMEFKSLGDFRINGDGSTIESVAENGYVEIAKREWFTTKRVRFEDNGQHQLERTYFVNGEPKTWTEATDRWVERQLQWLIRQGLGAKQFVQRAIEANGIEGALALTAQQPTPRVQWYYLAALRPHLTEENFDAVLPLLESVATSMIKQDSSYRVIEMAEAYIEPASFDLFVNLTSRIRSPYYKAMLLQTLVSKSDSSEQVEKVMRQIPTIGSDYYRAVTLIYAFDSVNNHDAIIDAYREAVASIHSGYYRNEVYSAAFESYKLNLDSGNWANLIDGVALIESDYYKTNALITAIKHAPGDDQQYATIVNVAATISSNYYQESVFNRLFKNFSMTEERWLMAFDVIAEMDSDYHKTSTLMKVIPLLEGEHKAIIRLIAIAAEMDSGAYAYSLLDHLIDTLSLDEAQAISFVQAIASLRTTAYRDALIKSFLKRVTITPAIEEALADVAGE